MTNQHLLVLLLVVFVASLCHSSPTTTSTTESIDNALNEKDNEILHDADKKVFKRDPKIPMAQDPRFNKMLPVPKLSDDHLETLSKSEKTQKTIEKSSSTTRSPTKSETSTIAFLPYESKSGKNQSDIQMIDFAHADIAKDDQTEEQEEQDEQTNYEDYYDIDDGFDEDEEDDDEEEDITEDNVVDSKTDAKKVTADNTKVGEKFDVEEDINEDDYEDENTDDSDDDDEEMDMDMDLNKANNEVKQCPRDCICERNMQAYLVATCSRLDLDTQSFSNLPITDLQVIDVGPRFPIVLKADFFKKIGLVNVTSIKIANSSIEYISPTAFSGLNDLYSVILTSIGIDLIHPDTFANNTKLKILTLSGNILNVMQSLSSPYNDYMLKSSSVEELDISYCNMQEFLPTAFSQLKSIMYINLAGNKLKTLPIGLFDKADTIEELDLSFNNIASLPKNIFNRTSLGILHLKHNVIVSSVDFVTKDVKTLDLSYNKITNVNNQMFKGMDNTNTLNLKGNKIRKIHPAAFVTLKNLRHIDLSFNDLDQISSLTFLKNSDLDVIRINDNTRLKALPNDGFESSAGSFNTYLFDVSNCDLDEISEKTFYTMPHLTQLILSYNNIQKVHKNLFSPLVKLMELDLSSNLLNQLDIQTFWNNQDLHKLNLASNPIESLSTKLFLPTPYLENLDINDCDLTTLWNDSSSEGRIGDLLKNLKFFNASNNDIKHIYTSDLSTMKNLKVFDVKNNPLECNDEFRSLMKFLGTRKISLGNRNIHNENEEMSVHFFEEMSPAIEWNEYARKICKRDEENKITNEQVLDDIDEETDDDYDDDDDEENDDGETETVTEVKPEVTKKPVSVTKAPREKTTVRIKKISTTSTSTSTTSSPSVIDSENDESEADEDYNYDDDETDDDEDREDEITDPADASKKDDSFLYEGVKIIQRFENRIMGGANKNEDSEDVIIEEAATSYRFFWPMLIVMFSILVAMIIIMTVISFCMRKRGERYRQALLASKNSIIYQKLSEEIGLPQTPKLHRYTPIQQV